VSELDLAVLVHLDDPGPQPQALVDAARARGIAASRWTMRSLSGSFDGERLTCCYEGRPVAPGIVLTQGLNRSWPLAAQLLGAAVATGTEVVNPISGSSVALDKVATAVALGAASVPTLRFQVHPWGARQLSEPSFPAPYVTKPTGGSNGRGVLDHPDWPAAAAWLGADRALGPTGEIGAELLQPLASGLERRVLVMDGRARAIVARRPLTGIVASWRNAEAWAIEDPEAARVAVAAVDALGLAYGAVDLIDLGDRCAVLEVNCWPRDLEVLGRLCGVNLFEALLDLVLARRRSPSAAPPLEGGDGNS